MRLETISEVDMSRRQFMKLGGQAAMAAAAPKTALKGLMGGAKKAARNVVISITPGQDIYFQPDLAKMFSSIASITATAGKIGNTKPISANLSGDSVETLVMSNLDKIDSLIKSGQLLAPENMPNEISNFQKPITQDDINRFRAEIKNKYVEMSGRGHTLGPNNKKSLYHGYNTYSEMEAGELKSRIESEKESRNKMHLVDQHGQFYVIEPSNSENTSLYNSISKERPRDPIEALWDDWIAAGGDLRHYQFSKPVMEIIKQKGLYRSRGETPVDLKDLKVLIYQWNKFGIALPADINMQIAASEQFSGQKLGELEYYKSDSEEWDERNKEEQKELDRQKKEKEDFEKTPPQDGPDSWRTQSVEFEHKLAKDIVDRRFMRDGKRKHWDVRDIVESLDSDGCPITEANEGSTPGFCQCGWYANHPGKCVERQQGPEQHNLNQFISRVYGHDDTAFDAISIRDEAWEEAQSIIKQAWDKGYRTLVFDDGILLMKEDTTVLKSSGIKGDQEPQTFAELSQLIDACSAWWQV